MSAASRSGSRRIVTAKAQEIRAGRMWGIRGTYEKPLCLSRQRRTFPVAVRVSGLGGVRWGVDPKGGEKASAQVVGASRPEALGRL